MRNVSLLKIWNNILSPSPSSFAYETIFYSIFKIGFGNFSPFSILSSFSFISLFVFHGCFRFYQQKRIFITRRNTFFSFVLFDAQTHTDLYMFASIPTKIHTNTEIKSDWTNLISHTICVSCCIRLACQLWQHREKKNIIANMNSFSSLSRSM